MKNNQEIIWYKQSHAEVAEYLEVEPGLGLTDNQAKSRLKDFGRNELEEKAGKSPWSIFADQFTNPLVLLLIGASIISAILGKWIDSGAVMAIVILNAILGFVQEYRAEKAMAALKKLSTPVTRVRRNGEIKDIPAGELVPGDVIYIEAGNAVPADARIIESANLRVQEAALTGESEPVEKINAVLDKPNLPLGDQKNLLFMGTSVSFGRGVAIVTGTGMNTQLGHIARLIQTVKQEPTPLQLRIAQLGKALAFSVLGIVAVAFALGLARGEEPVKMFQTAVSMAVAAVPEGLPAVVTIVLAFGAQRMLKRKALIRKLPAVETLGSVTVICSDKTGTLTENRMTVTILDVAGHTLNFEESIQKGHPILFAAEDAITPKWPAHTLLLTGAALCTDAVIQSTESTSGNMVALGDPTEAALVIAAAKAGLFKDRLEILFPRIAEAPFSSERRLMSTVHVHAPRVDSLPVLSPSIQVFSENPHGIIFTKGGVDSLLSVTSGVWEDGIIHPIDADYRNRILDANNRLALQGLRVLGVAYRPALPTETQSNQLPETAERDLILIGLVGMMDPPREEVAGAVQTCLQAGIRPIMITGDQPLTALQIGRMLKIIPEQETRVLTGVEIDRMDDDALRKSTGEISIYARVSPENKLRIVNALQQNGEVAAMTGDGVNDAPALRKSDIGVAMGITGTDVSKEAASMVILDDNFATIVHAVEEGRRVYDNVRKFIRYTLGSNAGEILVMFFAPLLGMPLPLTPLQILWMNLVTDGLPGLALTNEPADPEIMNHPPVKPGESIFSRGVGAYIFRIGVVMAVITLAFGWYTYNSGNPNWSTMIFTLLIFLQIGHALGIRSDSESIFKQPVKSNPFVYYAAGITVFLQMAAIYWPPMQKLFNTTPLTVNEFLVTLVASFGVMIWIEFEKITKRRKLF
jgi:Ca2+-transporting ATPase